MADVDEIRALKGNKILVQVEEALFDVIVVAFHHGTHLFQGALLDVSKKNCPLGINPFQPWGSSPGFPIQSKEHQTEEDERYHALKQRFTYFQQPPPMGASPQQLTSKNRRVATARGIRDQGVRMRRLRPRQVLCSQCRSICNENSDNVQKLNDGKQQGRNALPEDRKVRKPETTLKTNYNYLRRDGNRATGIRITRQADEYRLRPTEGSASGRMILRKRKPNEDQVESPASSPAPLMSSPSATPTAEEEQFDWKEEDNSSLRGPVIKISFANPQGQDTVVEIPARNRVGDASSTKAAKRALKKAKKEAQRKAIGSSPSPLSESNSPSMNTGNLVVALRRHKHHKHHKVKRKRRHRTFSDESSSGPGGQDNQDENRLVEDAWRMAAPFTVADIRPSDGLYEEVRNNCLRQKLSISLKRLSARAYARCSPRPHGSNQGFEYPVEYQTRGEENSGSESDNEDVPNFPRHEVGTSSSSSSCNGDNRPLMMRISTHSVPCCSLENGRQMRVGDIVWGKIHGFPWWPGKVLALSISQRDTGLTISQQAHVSWFASSTSSLMPCHQLAPFLLDFKSRYNRKKRGPYKEAIRQATLEAQQLGNEQQRLLIVNSLSPVNQSLVT